MQMLKDPVKRGWIAAALIGVLALSLLAPFVVGREARHLSAFRDGEEDASVALGEMEAKAATVEAFLGTAHALADIEEPHKALFVVMGTERRYTPSETDAIVAFLKAGGNVMLADEGGYGSDIAKEAGFAFGGAPLLDTQNHLGDTRLVAASARLDGVEYPLLFNAPTFLVPLSNAGAYEVLAQSSAPAFPDGSYADINGNGEIERSDTPGPWPLVVRTSVGAGTLVLLADTGVFMNRQTELLDYRNAAFLGELTRTLVPRDGRIVIDEGRHAPPAPLALYAWAVHGLARATSGPVAPFLTALVLVGASVAAWRLTRPTEDWSRHAHTLGEEIPVPADVRPDHDRAQRMARRAVSERFNIPMEQVAAMPADQLVALTGDRVLSEAAAGTLKSDPAPIFRAISASSVSSITPEAPR